MSSSRHRSSGETYSLPRSVRWIETLLWEVFVDPRNLNVGAYTTSDAILVNGIDSTLTFSLMRTSPEILTLSCIRNVSGSEQLDDNCYIKLYISLYNFEERARPGIMSLQQSSVVLHYDIQSHRNVTNQKYEILMKCSIRVVEMENTSNSERERQIEELFLMTREVSASPDQLIEMAYVLRRPHLDDVYTGRMDPVPASFMSALIANACQYSRYIYEYIRARDRSDPRMPNIPLTEILFRMCQPHEFNEDVCFKLFTMAHRLGLEFLRVLCSAWLIENLNDNSVLYTLLFADWTEDTELFRSAALYLTGRFSIIATSDKWEMLKQDHDGCRHSIIRNLFYRSTTGDWLFPPLPEDEVGEQ